MLISNDYLDDFLGGGLFCDLAFGFVHVTVMIFTGTRFTGMAGTAVILRGPYKGLIKAL